MMRVGCHDEKSFPVKLGVSCVCSQHLVMTALPFSVPQPAKLWMVKVYAEDRLHRYEDKYKE